ncbi:MAG: LuxR C-terminal-related transcriptional regulator [Flavobacteriales bacterium]|nr:LuxR C-terminal-related transcriptional regulator [Flavobacteriales bacterium]
MNDRGSYSRAFITDVPADLNTEIARTFNKIIPKYPEEGVYIYSFMENKMLYAHGWEEVAGISSDELSMLDVVNFTAPQYAPFVEEVNDKALQFLHERNQRLTEYSFTIEIKITHKDGLELPIHARVSVHDVNDDGTLASIMGQFHVNRSLRFGKVMRYRAYGPEKEAFENALDSELFKSLVISPKELEALHLAAKKGYGYKQIAAELNVSQSAIEKRIYPMFERFGVVSLGHLINFAHENYLFDSFHDYHHSS